MASRAAAGTPVRLCASPAALHVAARRRPALLAGAAIPRALPTPPTLLSFPTAHARASSTATTAVAAAGLPAHAPATSAAYRSHLCGDLRAGHAGAVVRLCGWVQNVRRLGASIVFVTLRDAYGLVQLTFSDDGGSGGATPGAAESSAAAGTGLAAAAGGLRLESVIAVTGVVALRPPEQRNAGMPTGDVEVRVTAMDVLGAVSADGLPFALGPATSALASVPEDTRLAHRPLDLRRGVMQRNLRLRSAVTQAIRGFLHGGLSPPFVEVDTPTLFRSTPEGAREFLVPTRQPGKAYALTQSPQQHKQMLMVGGLDRYFQVARCYRDEAGRADRQPEFTQIDLELSFATPTDVMAVTEGVVAAAFDTARAFAATAGSAAPPPATVPAHVAVQAAHMASVAAPPLPAWAPLALPLPRLTFTHALTVYGSDKPDRRWGMRLGDVSALLLAEAGAALDVATPAGVPPSPLHTVLRHLRAGGINRKAPQSSSSPASVVRPSETDVDLSPLLPGAFAVRGFVAPGLSGAVTRKEWDALTADVARAVTKGSAPAPVAAAHGSAEAQQQLAQLATAPAVFCLRVEPDGTWRGSPAVTKVLPPAAQRAASAALGAAPGDAVVLGAGAGLPLCAALGAARLLVADSRRRRGLPPPPDAVSTVVGGAAGGSQAAAEGDEGIVRPDLFWVTDFPLLELADAESPSQAPTHSPSPLGGGALPRLQSVHHPFTAPHPDDAPLLRRLMAAVEGGGAPADAATTADALLRVRGQHYDLVCSGVELGGGSVRVHDPALQRFILAHLLRVSLAQLQGFGPLLDALASGAPPHGGLALGLDRLVATLAGPRAAASVRDVIAFPKSAAGNDALTGAPAALEPHQWAELHLAPVPMPAQAVGGAN